MKCTDQKACHNFLKLVQESGLIYIPTVIDHEGYIRDVPTFALKSHTDEQFFGLSFCPFCGERLPVKKTIPSVNNLKWSDRNGN